MKTDVSLPLRLFGGLAGLVLGGIVGAIIVGAVTIVTGKSLTFDRILLGSLGGAGIGVILGLLFPRVLGSKFVDMLSGILDGL